MNSSLNHLQINVNAENLAFYRDLMEFLGQKTEFVADNVLGCWGSNGVSLWFLGEANDASNDYDGRGVNHLAMSAASQKEVDATVAYIKEMGVPALFETPRHRPDFAGGDSDTYYQVMFESPDRVLFEVVYQGPKE